MVINICVKCSTEYTNDELCTLTQNCKVCGDIDFETIVRGIIEVPVDELGDKMTPS